jgi:hypothetical protein
MTVTIHIYNRTTCRGRPRSYIRRQCLVMRRNVGYAPRRSFAVRDRAPPLQCPRDTSPQHQPRRASGTPCPGQQSQSVAPSASDSRHFADVIVAFTISFCIYSCLCRNYTLFSSSLWRPIMLSRFIFGATSSPHTRQVLDVSRSSAQHATPQRSAPANTVDAPVPHIQVSHPGPTTPVTQPSGPHQRVLTTARKHMVRRQCRRWLGMTRDNA